MVPAAGNGSRHAEEAEAEVPPPASGRDDPGEVLGELRDVLVAYFRQEAVEPLKRLAAWLGFGLAGGVFMSTGLVLLALAALRALQTETGDHLGGSLSWSPYAIVLVGILMVFMVTRAAARARRRGTGESAE